MVKDETKASRSIQNRIKQILVEQEFLHIIAMKEKGAWKPHELHDVIKSRLAERFENPQFTVSISQVKRAKDNLTAGGFVTSEDHPEGKQSIIRLSSWGLLRELETIFQNEEGATLIEKIDKVVTAQSQMLIIFKKWSYIDSQGLKSKVIELMKSFFASYPTNYHHTSITCIVEKLCRWGFQTSSQQIEEYQFGYFCDNLLLVYNFLPKDEQWYKMLANDSAIRDFAQKRFKLYRRQLTIPLEELDQRSSFFE